MFVCFVFDVFAQCFGVLVSFVFLVPFFGFVILLCVFVLPLGTVVFPWVKQRVGGLW